MSIRKSLREVGAVENNDFLERAEGLFQYCVETMETKLEGIISEEAENEI